MNPDEFLSEDMRELFCTLGLALFSQLACMLPPDPDELTARVCAVAKKDMLSSIAQLFVRSEEVRAVVSTLVSPQTERSNKALERLAERFGGRVEMHTMRDDPEVQARLKELEGLDNA